MAPFDSAPVSVDEPVPSYVSPGWLPGRHTQTIYPVFVARPRVALRREHVDTPDGDFWDFHWLDGPPSAPLVVLFHGLEGNASSPYARALLAALAQSGWRGVVPHFRGCGGRPNRLPRAYHSGDHAEIGAMLAAIAVRTDPAVPVYAVGVSLGGSALLNWLGRAGTHAGKRLQAAAAVSTPLDLYACGLAIDRGFNRVYAWHFLATLKPKSLALARRFPGRLDPARIRRAFTLWAFDDAVTAPLHGFAGTEDYWKRGSSKPWLPGIRLPTLVLNARNDPFVPEASLPGPAEISRDVVLEQPAHGGHGGFPAGRWPGSLGWLPQRLLRYFASGT